MSLPISWAVIHHREERRSSAGSSTVATVGLLSTLISLHSTVFLSTFSSPWLRDLCLACCLSFSQTSGGPWLSCPPVLVRSSPPPWVSTPDLPSHAREDSEVAATMPTQPSPSSPSSLPSWLSYRTMAAGGREEQPSRRSVGDSKLIGDSLRFYFSVFLLETWQVPGRRQVCWPQLWCTKHSSMLSTLDLTKTAPNILSARRGKKWADWAGLDQQLDCWLRTKQTNCLVSLPLNMTLTMKNACKYFLVLDYQNSINTRQ